MAYFYLPFTNLHELNLDWIVQQIKQQQTDLKNFVSLNTIKYANPFQWNITSQYEQNTLVIDPQTGTAYLSLKPVPQGVQIKNTEYWTAVFTLQTFIDPLKEAICRTIPQQENGQAASQTIPANSLFFVGDILCTNSAEIPNTSLVVIGSNCQQVSVEELLENLSQQIAAETEAREQADTAEQTAREQADTELGQQITAEQEARKQADTELGNKIAAEQSAREEADAELQEAISKAESGAPYVVNVKDYGAKGDGVTDDSAAIDAARAAMDAKGCHTLYFPDGVYNLPGKTYTIDTSKERWIGEVNSTLKSSGLAAGAVFITLTSSLTLEVYQYGRANLENLCILGSYNTGVSDNAAPHLGVIALSFGVVGKSDATLVAPHIGIYNVGIRGFYIGVYLGCAYKTTHCNVSIIACNVGYFAPSDGLAMMVPTTVLSPHIECCGFAFYLSAAGFSLMNVYGGAIEYCRSFAWTNARLQFFGTRFESDLLASCTSALAPRYVCNVANQNAYILFDTCNFLLLPNWNSNVEYWLPNSPKATSYTGISPFFGYSSPSGDLDYIVRNCNFATDQWTDSSSYFFSATKIVAEYNTFVGTIKGKQIFSPSQIATNNNGILA